MQSLTCGLNWQFGVKQIFLIFSVYYAMSCPGHSKDGSESGRVFFPDWDLGFDQHTVQTSEKCKVS